MTLYDYFGREVRKIGFLGLGRSNLSLLGCLPLSGVKIALRSDGKIDRSKIPTYIGNPEIYEGKSALLGIDEDVLILSPSVRRDRPELLLARERGVVFSSDAELFFSQARGDIFAVTGSDGKSTVTAMCGELLRQKRSNLAVIGNIGVPMLPEITPCRTYVTEISSFCLTYLNAKIRRGAVTNITPNHLNWHESFAEYRDSKLSLLTMADEGVISFDDGELRKAFTGREIFGVTSDRLHLGELKKLCRAEVYITRDENFIYRNGEVLLPVSCIRRREGHNVKNLMTAIALCDGYADSADALRVASEFSGLAHRAQVVASQDGVDYIDSSIDTTPSRTAMTLESLGRSAIIILGGRGKGLGYEALLPALKKYVRYAIVTGEDREKIAETAGGQIKTEVIADFAEAVQRACLLARRGDAVLLSPAATSYDAFSSFEERGLAFEKIVLNYCGNNRK